MSTLESHGSGIRSVGGLLPSEFLARVRDPRSGVGGLREADYHLAVNERLGEIITRSWNRLVEAWRSFSERLRESDDPTDTARALTRERWLGPLFNELGFGRLSTAKSIEINGQIYPLSNEWQKVPIHLVGAKVPLDRRSAGVRGAAGMSPHALVQEILNRSETYLWGMVSNGLILRLLRDSTSLTRQSYLEFDLEVIFSNERYEDFVTLWMVMHQSRLEGEDLTQCWLEKWRAEINTSGVRALDALRGGVEKAIESLGRGFIAHPDNQSLREALRNRDLTGSDYYREILRLVYRILFLFVAEDRDLLHAPDIDREIKDRYKKWYSTERLRNQAWGIRSDRHDDMWQMLSVVMEGLGNPDGISDLGIAPLGSFLWSEEAISNLVKCRIVNSYFGEALVHLSTTQSEGVRRSVDFANLGAEELGSVYEALLELYPEIEVDTASFKLLSSSGNERKTSGSYYTPSELVASLLESALDPVLERAAKEKDPESAILALKVFDPACGSGHFLIAAAHRIAQKLAQVRTGEPEASPSEVRHALREVVAKCCYGVDINPMAVELAKVSLWMEAMEAGKPLTFLERHIVVGNALFGTTPALVAAGVPDEAYNYLEGDSKPKIKDTKALNKKIRLQGLQTLNLLASAPKTSDIIDKVVLLESLPDDDLMGIQRKAALWDELKSSSELETTKLAADVWCAAFVNEKLPDAAEITTETVNRALEIGRSGVALRELEAVDRLAGQYRFLHLHVVFPEIFRSSTSGRGGQDLGWEGGFDVVLGNPPWEKVKLAEKEFFATSAPEIVKAKGANRKALIKKLEVEDPGLFASYQSALRQASGESSFLIKSGRYPLTGKGDVNTYAIFAEMARTSLSPTGQCGIIVPTGIATDDSTSVFFSDLTGRQSIVSLYDFENRKNIFPAVDSRQKFCLLTITGSALPAKAGTDFVFFAHELSDLSNADRRIRISADEIRLFNPNTGTTPIFRNRNDAEIAKQVYQKVPVLIKEGPPEENPWGISFKRLFDMTNDSALFATRSQCEEAGAKLEGNIFVNEDGTRLLPLYEGKLIHHFDHRFATYEGVTGDKPDEVSSRSKEDPNFTVLPWYWVPEHEVDAKLEGWDRKWLMGFRGIARTTDERTVISAVYPVTAVGNSLPLLRSMVANGHLAGALIACISSYALDLITRMKVGGSNFNFYIVKQLPVLPPDAFETLATWSDVNSETVAAWISRRVVELTYTSPDMKPWAEELGYDGPPFSFNEERRQILRAELDACFFHLYGYSKEQVEYAMDSFPIVKKNDIDEFGSYLTKELILKEFDAMQTA